MRPRSIVVADRGYRDCGLLDHWDSNDASFAVRHKENIRYVSRKERPLPGKAAQDVLVDGEMELELQKSREKYEGRLRRIAALYKAR